MSLFRKSVNPYSTRLSEGKKMCVLGHVLSLADNEISGFVSNGATAAVLIQQTEQTEGVMPPASARLELLFLPYN